MQKANANKTPEQLAKEEADLKKLVDAASYQSEEDSDWSLLIQKVNLIILYHLYQLK